mmetsp:Transcript_18345/g.51884  ORF Transcript_18345/g.51884 Transcript_18345/m.51884 type:complete len:216 (+) Transcript_18345:738-1385(+)
MRRQGVHLCAIHSDDDPGHCEARRSRRHVPDELTQWWALAVEPEIRVIASLGCSDSREAGLGVPPCDHQHAEWCDLPACLCKEPSGKVDASPARHVLLPPRYQLGWLSAWRIPAPHDQLLTRVALTVVLEELLGHLRDIQLTLHRGVRKCRPTAGHWPMPRSGQLGRMLHCRRSCCLQIRTIAWFCWARLAWHSWSGRSLIACSDPVCSFRRRNQ